MEKVAHFFSLKAPRKTWLKNEVIILGLILLAAIVLRFYRIGDYMVFLGDEGRDMLVGYNILHGNLTLLGPTASVGGFFLGPIYYYFMTPFLWLWNYNPVGPSVMVAILGVATVFLVYKISTEFFSRRVGLTASFLYAISPIVVNYSRSSWNPNVVPFFSLLTVYFVYKARERNNPLLFIATGVLLGIGLQLHYLFTFMGAFVFFFLIADGILKKNILPILRNNILVFIGFLIGFSPFLLFEVRHEFTNSKNIINFLLYSKVTGAGGHFLRNVDFVFLRLFGGLPLSLPQSNGPELWRLASYTLGVAGIGSLFLYLKDNRKEIYRFLALFLWGIVGILLFMFYKKEVHDYYLGFLFPLPFILIALFVDKLFNFKLLGKVAGVLLITVIAVLSLAHTHHRIEPNKQVEQARDISRFLLDKTGDEPFNFALLSPANSDHAYRYFFKIEGKDPVTLVPPHTDPKRNSVQDQLFVICEAPPCKPVGHSLWEIAGFGPAKIEEEWGYAPVRIYKLVHNEEK